MEEGSFDPLFLKGAPVVKETHILFERKGVVL